MHTFSLPPQFNSLAPPVRSEQTVRNYCAGDRYKWLWWFWCSAFLSLMSVLIGKEDCIWHKIRTEICKPGLWAIVYYYNLHCPLERSWLTVWLVILSIGDICLKHEFLCCHFHHLYFKTIFLLWGPMFSSSTQNTGVIPIYVSSQVQQPCDSRRHNIMSMLRSMISWHITKILLKRNILLSFQTFFVCRNCICIYNLRNVILWIQSIKLYIEIGSGEYKGMRQWFLKWGRWWTGMQIDLKYTCCSIKED